MGALYAVNTFGAVAGVILAGYQLLPALGNRRTLAVAVVANLLVGAAAIAYSRRLGAVALGAAGQPDAPPAPAASVSVQAPDPGVRLTLIALGVSGAVSIIYEVAWTRALAQVIGSSTYAFTAMLVAFLLGIVGGAAVYSRIWGERRASPGVFALIQCGIGVAAGLVLLGFDRMPALFLFPLIWSDSPAFVQFVQLAVSALALLPSTLLIGATFPCAVAACARSPARAGEEVGRLYAANTVGAIGGAMVAGFVLVPALGVQGAIKAGIVVNLALAGLLSVAWPRPVPVRRWALFDVSLVGR